MNVLRFIAKSIPAFVIILVIVELLWSNSLVGSGREIRGIDVKIAELRQENTRLEQKVASASSLMAVTQKATEMGFVEPTRKQFVMMEDSLLPVALAHTQ